MPEIEFLNYFLKNTHTHRSDILIPLFRSGQMSTLMIQIETNKRNKPTARRGWSRRLLQSLLFAGRRISFQFFFTGRLHRKIKFRF